MKYLFIFLLLFGAATAESAVWQHNPNLQWNQEWQARYSQWIESQVDGRFFKNLGHPFAGVRLDCADAHYALVAYFARQNGLPFTVNNGQTTNLTTRFDYIGDPDQRLAAFMKSLRGDFGTEALVHRDTYPPRISDLAPGDLFMWKIGTNGNYTRHTYIIKSVNSNGTFDVLYSTQANAAANGPLKTKTQHMFSKAPTRGGSDQNRWGFRRMKMAHQSTWPQENIPGASFEQYQWARNLSGIAFFDRVQKANQTSAENPNSVVSRLFQTLCSTIQERVGIVQEALRRQQQLGNRCMNYSDFDAHSTPGRDSGIMNDYNRLEYTIKNLNDTNQAGSVKVNTWNLAFDIFYPISEASNQQLYKACPIRFGPNNDQWTDLATFREALFGGQVSFHPNDNIYRRWGYAAGSKTRCEQFYGYPDQV